MPLTATIENFLLTADELSIYKEIDKHLIIQLSTLPDLVRTYNERNPVVAIKKVTNTRTLCELMNDNLCQAVRVFLMKCVYYFTFS